MLLLLLLGKPWKIFLKGSESGGMAITGLSGLSRYRLWVFLQDNRIGYCGALTGSGSGFFFFSGSGKKVLKTVLWIRIWLDSELFPGSGIIVPDPDPARIKELVN